MKASYLLRLTSVAIIAYIPVTSVQAGVLDFDSLAVGEIAGQAGWAAGPLSINGDGVDAYTVSATGVSGSNGLRVTRDEELDNFSSVFWTPDSAFLGSDLINANGGQKYAYSFDIDLLSPDTGSLGGNLTSIRIYLCGAVQTANNNATGYASISISDTGQVSRYGEPGIGGDGLSLAGYNTISGIIDFANMTQTIFINGNEYTASNLEPLQLGVAGGVVDTDPNATFGQVAILMRLQNVDMVIDNFSISALPADPDAPVAVIALSGANDISVSFQSVEGVNYLLEFSDDGMATWSSTGVSGVGDGTTMTLTDTGGRPDAGSSSFYRVVASN